MKGHNFSSLDFPGRGLFLDLFGPDVYLIGGTVRDCLLGGCLVGGKDVDLLVCGRSYGEIATVLHPHGRTNTVGKSFAVIKFNYAGLTYDIAVPRRERKLDLAAHDHRNFRVESGPEVSLEEDLGRRDFTCNAMALRLSDANLVDPLGGYRDIRDRLLRMANPESFADDPLRVLRCARFAAVLNFSVDEGIYRQALGVVLSQLSAERVCEELLRLLLEAPRPAVGLREYLRLGILEKLFPELYALTLTIQDSWFHPETDEFGHHSVWAHTLAAVDLAAHLARANELDQARALALMLAALFHDLGKALTTRWEYRRGRLTVTSPWHDSRGMDLLAGTLERLRLESRHSFPLRETVLSMVRYHHRLHDLYRNRAEINFKAISRLVRDMNGEDLLLVLLDLADRRSRLSDPWTGIERDELLVWFARQKEIFRVNAEVIKPLVMGRHLAAQGLPAGVEMGRWLKLLYEKQLDGDFSTLEQGLEIFHREWSAADSKERDER